MITISPALASLAPPPPHFDSARVRCGFDGVGLPPAPVVDIDDLDFFKRENVGLLHESGIDRNRAYVVKLRPRHSGPVNLAV